MSDEIVFYTNPMSRGWIIRWMLEEVGAPYRTEIIRFGPSAKPAEFLAINPMGKVPTIQHRGAVVTEAAAICAYLADAFPKAGLAPPSGDPARAAYYRWLFFAAGPVEAAIGDRVLGVQVPPERKGTIGYGSFEDVMNTLEYAVSEGDYLAGNAFTAADLYVASHLAWGMQFGTIERRSAFEAYAQRATSRPAARRASELDDALLAQVQPG